MSGRAADVAGAVWASLPMPALMVDAADLVADANPAAETFLNASRKALIGKPVWQRLSVDAAIEQALARVRRTEAPLFVNAAEVGTGRRRSVSCDIQIAPVAEFAGHVLILLDSRELEDRLALAHHAQTAAKSAIGMAEMLAHEIKNPLAGIAGAAQLISMNATGEDRGLTDLIVAETRRVVALLEQVEEFGNLRPPARRAVNLHDVLDRAHRSASVGFAAHMAIAEEYDPSLPPAWADADQLLQVVLNLLKNAAEAGGPGGTIRLRSFYDASLRLRGRDGAGTALPLQIEVEDDGPGLPPDLADDIFDPFVSGRENGTGLGLALVSKIVGDHGGWIGVDSGPGRTIFRVSLPRAPRSPDPDR